MPSCMGCGSKVGCDCPEPVETYLSGVALTVTKFDDESIWIQKDDAEGMQLRLDDKWWNDNF